LADIQANSVEAESKWGCIRGKWLFNRSYEASKYASYVKESRQIQHISISRRFLTFLLKDQFPAFPVHITFFLLLYHVFIRHSTNSRKEPCLTTEYEALEYDGIQKMKNLKLEPGASGWPLQPLSVSCKSRASTPSILALLNGG
jgi:hypothetical protein